MDTTENQPDKMSMATEAVKRALIGVTQDGGCKPETIALVHQAVNIWDTAESEVCGELRNQLGIANDTIRVLHQNLQDRSKELATLTARCSERDKQLEELLEEKEKLRVTVKQQAGLIEAFDEAMKVVELKNKREIHFGYDPDREEFYVVFRSGQRITFDRAKNITGNVENWLATLRHQVTE